MRRLLYVPIIHNEADLGSAGATLAQKSAALSGDRRWMMHKETVDKFWETVATYTRSFDPHKLRVYQDGLAADGETGRRIVREAVVRGSKNYQLVLELLDRGAELRTTEDPVLLLQEHENLLRQMHQEFAGEGEGDTEQYRLQRDRLMEERDRFIAETIGTTLKEGEVGVLFVGADHDVATRLPADISVTAVKDPEKVMAYFEELLHGQDERNLAVLAQNLTSPASLS